MTYGPFARGQLLRIECLYWIGNTTLALSPAAGDLAITVRNASGYANGNPIVIDPGTPKEEYATVSGAPTAAGVITISAGLRYGHTAGATVGELADPTAATVALKNGGVTAAPAVTAESTGRWAGTYAIPDLGTSHGLWEGRTLATGAVQAADTDWFQVEVSAF